MISSATSTENSREYNNMFLMNNHFSVKKSPIIDLISQSRLNNINEKALSFNKKHFTNLFRIQSKKKIYDGREKKICRKKTRIDEIYLLLYGNNYEK